MINNKPEVHTSPVATPASSTCLGLDIESIKSEQQKDYDLTIILD